MSKIDWDGKLEAYHEDGRVVPCRRFAPEDEDTWPDPEGQYHVDGGEDVPLFFEADGSAWRNYNDCDWRIRNVTEPKADIEAWAYSIVRDLDDAEVDCMTNGYMRLRDAFARYVMTKEEAPIDPDLISAREVVCGYHHDKHPESPWHVGQAEMVRSGAKDNMLDVLAAYHGIKRGRELERGEVK